MNSPLILGGVVLVGGLVRAGVALTHWYHNRQVMKRIRDIMRQISNEIDQACEAIDRQRKQDSQPGGRDE